LARRALSKQARSKRAPSKTRGRARRPLAVLALAAAVAATALVPATAANAVEVLTQVQTFDDGGAAWKVGSGAASIAGSTDRQQGTQSLALGYDLTSGPAAIVPKATPAALPTTAFSALKVAVKGDGSYNTLYAVLTDDTGEEFTYRVDNLNTVSWKTTTVDLAVPHGVQGGDLDRVLDTPLSLTKLWVERNGSQPAAGTVLVDDIRLAGEGWTAPVSSVVNFSAASSQTTALSFSAGGPGDYSLTLTDSTGRTRTLTGTATAAGSRTVTWGGADAGGVQLSGVVSAVLRHDATPNGTVSGTTATVGRQSLVTVTEPPAAASILESFETAAVAWKKATGGATLAATTTRTHGARALSIGYDVSSGRTELVPAGTAVPVAAKAYTTLKVDLRGDGSYNTLYAYLTDATGEVFYYRVDSLNQRSWKTVGVDLAAPTQRVGGNGDGVLDAPIALARLAVVRNDLQPATGTVLVDHVRVTGDGWTLPVATVPAGQKNFVPSAAQTAKVAFTAGTSGDYALQLSDATGLVRTFTGTLAAAKAVSVTFDGRSDGGALLGGTVSAVLSYDRTPDGAFGGAVARSRVPYLTGVAARLKVAGNASVVGINGDLMYAESAAESNRRTKLMEDAYVHYTREELLWEAVEPSKGTFVWDRADRVVADADSRNLDVIGRLGYSAPWASSAPAGTAPADVSVYPPTRLSDYIDYVKATVTRYKGSVKVWEVWNEQNSSLFWAPAPDAHAYATMLKEASAAIHAIDPTATVISGGLVGFDLEYMEVLRLDGALDAMDGFGLHTFVDVAPESSESNTWVDAAEAYLARWSPGKRIWITEVAWSTCTPQAGVCDSGVSEAVQAQYLSRAYLDAADRGVAAIAWWNLVEFGGSASKLDNYGLTDRSGRQKPAYQALVRVGAALDNAVVVGTASPTTGTTTRIADLASVSGWSVIKQGGATATLATTTSKHGGSGGAKLTYGFPGAATGVRLQAAIPVTGTPTALSVWTYGDLTGSPVYLHFRDTTGETFTALVGDSAAKEWKRMTLYFDGANANWSHAGGDADGVVDYPITATGVTVHRSLVSGVTSGAILIDDLTAHYGAVTRGIVLAGGGVETKALYSTTTTALRASVPGTTARLKTGATSTALTVTSNTVGVTTGADPIFVTSPLGVTATSTRAQGVVIRWESGDRADVQLDIVDGAGSVVRALGRARYDSGAQTFTWDGKSTAGATVPAGAYRVRLMAYDGDGARATVYGAFIRSS
jgi:hypothetical protein